MNFESVIEIAVNILGILSLIFGVIGGTYAGILWIRKTVFAPRIKLTFEKDRTFLSARDAKSGVKYIWIHVQAYNNSKSVFHTCKAYLTDVQAVSVDPSVPAVIEFNTILPLAWAHSGGMRLIDLLPEKQSAIDLFMVDHIHKLLVTCTDQIPSGTQKSFMPGEYILEVQCFSNDARPGKISLRIKWEGSNPYPTVEEL